MLIKKAYMYFFFLYILQATTPKCRNQSHLKLQTIRWLILLYWFHHTHFLIASSSQKKLRSGKPHSTVLPRAGAVSHYPSNSKWRFIQENISVMVPTTILPMLFGSRGWRWFPWHLGMSRLEFPNTSSFILVLLHGLNNLQGLFVKSKGREENTAAATARFLS